MISKISGGMLLSEIANITGGTLCGEDLRVNSLSTDSREIADCTLFLAIKGEKVDGHDYMKKAYENGMSAFVCEYIPAGCEGFSAVVVPNVIKALGQMAREYVKRFNIIKVGVTGSVGKTTTKEMIYSVLSTKYKTLKTEGNHNNHIGLPMTLFGIDGCTEAAVIEMGMSGRGEIAYLSSIVCPDVAVITNIGSSHIEKLGSRENIALAKLEIKEGMSDNGVLITDGDEQLLSSEKNAVKVGKSQSCTYRIANVIQAENGSGFDIFAEDQLFESVVVPALGEHNVKNACFAFALGRVLGMNEYEIRRGLMAYITTGMRQNVTQKQGRTVIEDCYNASPESMTASIKVLNDMAARENKRAVAVLGNMLELGDYSVEAHKKVGAAVALSNISLLVTVGEDALYIARSAVEFGFEPSFVAAFENTDDVESIGKFLLKNTDKNDIILFKASRGVRLERVIDYLKAN